MSGVELWLHSGRSCLVVAMPLPTYYSICDGADVHVLLLFVSSRGAIRSITIFMGKNYVFVEAILCLLETCFHASSGTGTVRKG
jgi:hypothetical protein